MPSRDECALAARAFKARHGVECSDENVVATLHLMNVHGLDLNGAMDQSSRSSKDYGIDAWYYDTSRKELFIYQSKLSDSKTTVCAGIADLVRASSWLEEVIVDAAVAHTPDNQCLYNLYLSLSEIRADIRRITFRLLSALEPSRVEDFSEYGEGQRALVAGRLNAELRRRDGGGMNLEAKEYRIDATLPAEIREYSVERIPNTRINLRDRAYLELAYLSLASLVHLYRERGDVLFDKNVRMSLYSNKEARERLVHPMEETLDSITSGRADPTLFSFFHIGVTISASTSSLGGETVNLAAPSVLNGCQTIMIAHEYLKKLEAKKALEAIARFGQIKIVAKIVVGTTNEELKEITNANNRQNPIENWQLFSNEPVHVELEMTLKDIGVFYERQKGKFEGTMKSPDVARYYPFTNGASVRIVDLAQVVALARRNTQWAAKPSEVFVNKESHDRCFDSYVTRNPRDIVFTANTLKALKRGMARYLALPAHVETNAAEIFRKPIVRAHVYSLGLLFFYQKASYKNLRGEFSRSLHKKANPTFVNETDAFYRSVVASTRAWYTEESKMMSVDVGKKRMDSFFETLAGRLGIDDSAARPFAERSIDWRSYQ